MPDIRNRASSVFGSCLYLSFSTLVIENPASLLFLLVVKEKTLDSCFRRNDSLTHPVSLVLDAGFRPRTTRSFCFGKRTQNHWRPGVAPVFPPLCKGRSGGVEPNRRMTTNASTSPCPSLQKRGIKRGMRCGCYNCPFATLPSASLRYAQDSPRPQIEKRDRGAATPAGARK